jgi:UDP-N-acetylglucosamine acyltransferase
MIHRTAVIHASAELGRDVEVGPYAIIGEHVRMGDGTRVGAHANIKGPTRMGEGSRIFSFAVIGEAPQDLKYQGEPTELVIGDHNVFREFVTIHRGTVQGAGRTSIGSHNLFMAYSHVAHDCVIGNHVIMANAATLAGHIEIQDYAIVGGLVAVHQYVRLGAYSLVGGFSGVGKDIPPYTLAAGPRAQLHGLNTVGLRRHGFSSKTIQGLKNAYRILFRSSLTLQKSIKRVRQEVPTFPELEHLLRFLENTNRGICR